MRDGAATGCGIDDIQQKVAVWEVTMRKMGVAVILDCGGWSDGLVLEMIISGSCDGKGEGGGRGSKGNGNVSCIDCSGDGHGNSGSDEDGDGNGGSDGGGDSNGVMAAVEIVVEAPQEDH